MECPNPKNSNLFAYSSPEFKFPSQTWGKQKPRWFPDDKTKRCFCCGKFFSLVNRRHHCRLCGGVYCSSCIVSSFFTQPLYQTAEEKICTGCFYFTQDNSQARLDIMQTEENKPEKQYSSTEEVVTELKNNLQKIVLIFAVDFVRQNESDAQAGSSMEKAINFMGKLFTDVIDDIPQNRFLSFGYAKKNFPVEHFPISVDDQSTGIHNLMKKYLQIKTEPSQQNDSGINVSNVSFMSVVSSLMDTVKQSNSLHLLVVFSEREFIPNPAESKLLEEILYLPLTILFIGVNLSPNFTIANVNYIPFNDDISDLEFATSVLKACNF